MRLSFISVLMLHGLSGKWRTGEGANGTGTDKMIEYNASFALPLKEHLLGIRYLKFSFLVNQTPPLGSRWAEGYLYLAGGDSHLNQDQSAAFSCLGSCTHTHTHTHWLCFHQYGRCGETHGTQSSELKESTPTRGLYKREVTINTHPTPKEAWLNLTKTCLGLISVVSTPLKFL